MEEQRSLATAIPAEIIEKVIAQGDLSKLTAQERVRYYNEVCQSLGLNPLTRPFEYLTLQGKMILYARRDCTEQLRKREQVSLVITSRETMGGVYVVTARATLPDGRTDESTGVVAIEGVKGGDLANAYMRAETKAKRRVTLSIVGLGWMDESELETTPAVRVQVDATSGEIVEAQVSPIASAPQAATEAVEPKKEGTPELQKVVVREGKMSREDAIEQYGVLQSYAVKLGLPINHDLVEAWRKPPFTQARLDGLRKALEKQAPPPVPVQAALGDEPLPEEEQ